MNKKLLVGSLLGVGTALFGVFIAKRRGLPEKIKEWKNERIRNAYYDTLTEKDIAWG